MNMGKYKIVYIKNDFIELFKEHPIVLKHLPIEEKSIFDYKQVQLMLNNMSDAVAFLKEELFLREDYYFLHGIHQLKNEITGKDIFFEVNHYDIEVYEKENSYVIYDYLRKFSSNFMRFDI